jgi:hypothetical protein
MPMFAVSSKAAGRLRGSTCIFVNVVLSFMFRAEYFVRVEYCAPSLRVRTSDP